MDINFNINYHVRVKLTKRGLDEMQMDHEKMYGLSKPFKPPISDSDGYVRFQMRDLMNRFGKMLYLGGYLPFEPNIIIEIKEI